MELPNNRVGISDILKWRECPRKMAYQMRRHTEGAQPPEDQHPDTLYGSCFHDMVEQVERHDLNEDEAVQFAFDKWGHILGPEDLKKIRADFHTYRERDDVGVRTVANESEIAVPLLEWEGETIFFRARIDRLYQRLDNEGVFIARDYKSSKWPKSEAKIHSDLQFWAYNWAIFEWWPEVEHLTQIYDQLRYGAIPTRKSEEQREEIREWLVREVTAILKDDDEEPEARFNQWCAYCPIKMDCPVIPRLSRYEAERIKVLDPGGEDDTTPIETYVERMNEAKDAIKTLEAYSDRVKKLLRELDDEARRKLGYKLTGRGRDTWGPGELERVFEVLGNDFFNVAGITKRKVEQFLGDDPRHDTVLQLAVRVEDAPQLRQV